MAKSGPRDVAPADEIKRKLVDAAVRVLARDGFAHASARMIASEAGSANGLIFYHFGSMDGLLAATARTLADEGIERIRAGLGGERAHRDWPAHLGEVIRREADGDAGRAVMELMVGARSSPLIAEAMQDTIRRALDFATIELRRVIDGTPLAQVLPVEPLAELAAAAFLGLEVLTMNGHHIDLDELAQRIALLLGALGAGGRR